MYALDVLSTFCCKTSKQSQRARVSARVSLHRAPLIFLAHSGLYSEHNECVIHQSGHQPQLYGSKAHDVPRTVAVEPRRRKVNSGKDVGNVRPHPAGVGLDSLDTPAAHLPHEKVSTDVPTPKALFPGGPLVLLYFLFGEACVYLIGTLAIAIVVRPKKNAGCPACLFARAGDKTHVCM